jgi:organic radical activating enzyme
VRKAAGSIKLVVFTGGEPLLQDPRALMHLLLADGFTFQFETAGTVWPRGLESLLSSFTVVCSPKTPRVHARIVEHCRNWKYIVRCGSSCTDNGVPVTNTQDSNGVPRPLFVPPLSAVRGDTIWLQPCEEYKDGAPDREATAANTQHCIKLCMEHGHRLSLQTHKILGLP